MALDSPENPVSPDLLAPLPLRSQAGGPAPDYRTVPFDRTDPRWTEPLVDLAAHGLATLAWYARTDGGNAPYHAPIPGAVKTVAARASVAVRLLAADRAVKPLGLRLLVVDAYRSIETQAGLWSFFETKIAREEPGLDAAAVEAKVRTFVSDPRRFDLGDDTTWPIHSTGGSVDVLLADGESLTPLDHGAAFDEAHERSFTDHLERRLAAGEIGPDDAALRNRRILVNAMLKAGFTNYVYEFWHFDYGTQLHIRTLEDTGPAAPSAAWYGTVPLPPGMA